jgi:hypothetical protein
MLFQDRPIEKPEDLYDREVEYETLRKAVNSRAICVIVGARRIGVCRSGWIVRGDVL